MGFEDILPDRGLTDGEFRQLQQQDTFDAVLRDDRGGLATFLFLQKDGTETALHYNDDEGWHVHHEDMELENPHPPTHDHGESCGCGHHN
ncbi:hypothetical protein Htur_4920 (plasmid) [Haloterrigena turkmenica DSM 5511]|uniref:DUF7964 domain-containing protein n=1 Tax=Haloterrigena turkmenica (strain ATCC 51198 / DSM 5511 / JCM 9101 / NCIMB 13204 / VKM B-1734 / 4k) TaxID=543526 RepID=D2S2R0_HALTV|nr:hypothetical protein [Haloterrigena turkmenica]ADB63657.1 hypothetical protein Htur_4920 [Haloterrigena turkmenica DSM 5511]